MNNIKKASSWIDFFENTESRNFLAQIYGNDNILIEEKKENYLTVLKSFIEKYGDKEVAISRAPGRINLMGRHIEHRGGNINTIAIHKETLMVASKREDDRINISNTDEKFSDASFSVSEELGLYSAELWTDYIDSNAVKERVAVSKGHWVNYVKSAALRFLFGNNEFGGMDIMCLGTVPVAGGVSSSSSIVVASAELVCLFNNLDLSAEEFILLCGQSEWYVGSRGGAGDHAAIKSGVINAFTPIAFEPVKVLEPINIPENYSVIVANSFIEAKKSEGAKDKFNQMVAAYEFGVMLVKKNYPQYKEKIIHLRDINTDNLNISEKEIYEMLMSVPLFLPSDKLFEEIPTEFHEKVERIISSHALPERYNVRSALLYGICECERSKVCAEILKSGKINEFAELMNISHDGDRVICTTDSGSVDYDYLATDEKLIQLIEKSAKGDKSTALWRQPGGYACSIPGIDTLIDSILKVKGVLSAQISGAGLGGCIMIFCEKAFENDVLGFLRTNYYTPNGFPDGAIIVKPIKGSMCL